MAYRALPGALTRGVKQITPFLLCVEVKDARNYSIGPQASSCLVAHLNTGTNLSVSILCGGLCRQKNIMQLPKRLELS